MTENKAGGILLMVIGVVVAAAWIAVCAFQIYERWYDFNIVHAKYICTYWEYFGAVGKIHVAHALFAGAIPGIAGICFFLKK